MKDAKRFFFWWVLLLGTVFSWTIAQETAAADYPNRPVKLILGFPPGGPADNCSGVIAKRAAEFLGQPIITEYKPGGGATIAPAFVAKSFEIVHNPT
jgi:tripartite-type tricarboxylate transporter receptor subunit TctC